METSFLNMAKRLQAIATTGIEFTGNQYDRERYEEISSIALTLLADIGQAPLDRIEQLVSPHDRGYVTPKVDVRAAVIQEDKILLVKEKTDGLWTLPGGYADVGLSPAENIEKEVREEAGIAVKARYLYAVRHKAKGDYDADVRDFYKLFFLCDRAGNDRITPGSETSDVGYFSRENIPPLSTGRVITGDLLAAWNFSRSLQKHTAFD